MKELFEWLNLIDLRPILRYRLILSVFCLLTFVILSYFWKISRKRANALNQNNIGLLFLSIAFGLYCTIGVVSVYYKGQMSVLFVLSALINASFLLSLSFFSTGTHSIDKVVQSKLWAGIVILIGLVLIFFNLSADRQALMSDVDLVFSSLAIFLLGFFLIRTFVKRGLKFLGLLSGLSILFIILLQIYSQDIFGQERFVHINTTILVPALFLSLLSISYTFGWVNELDFHEISRIYTDDKPNTDEKELVVNKPLGSIIKGWQEKIINDEVEEVIEQIIVHKRLKNENLGLILNVAQRNNRNNTNQLKGLIRYEEFQVNRNQISEALIQMTTK